MPAAVFVFLDTPRKGHSPRNWLSTTLFTKEELINIISSSLTILLTPLSVRTLHCLPSGISRFPVFLHGTAVKPMTAAFFPAVHAVFVAAGLYLGHILALFLSIDPDLILDSRQSSQHEKRPRCHNEDSTGHISLRHNSEPEKFSGSDQFAHRADTGQRKGKAKPHADSVKQGRNHRIFGSIGFRPS